MQIAYTYEVKPSNSLAVFRTSLVIRGRGAQAWTESEIKKGLTRMLNLLKELHKDESGQDIIEYVFIAAAISVASVALIPGIATKVTNYWTTLSNSLTWSYFPMEAGDRDGVAGKRWCSAKTAAGANVPSRPQPFRLADIAST
jgi:Flp pilus assembly pilin Flp